MHAKSAAVSVGQQVVPAAQEYGFELHWAAAPEDDDVEHAPVARRSSAPAKKAERRVRMGPRRSTKTGNPPLANLNVARRGTMLPSPARGVSCEQSLPGHRRRNGKRARRALRRNGEDA